MKLSLVASVALASTVSAFPTFNLVKPRQGWTWGAPSYGYETEDTPTYAAAATTTGSGYGASPSSSGTSTSSSPQSSSSGSSSSGGSTGTASGSATDACDIGYCTQNGGTTGGGSGSSTTVSTLDDLKTAASADGAAIIIVDGTISGAEQVDVSSDKTIIGATGSSLEGVGLRVKDQTNVIIRNMKISKVLADSGDAITIQASSNVWVDHCDLSSDRDHDKDYYDGLCDVTHGSDYVTISNSYIHDHWKASLVGHSDSNADEDTGHLIVTYANNYWSNINSRGPSFRFGTGHVFK